MQLGTRESSISFTSIQESFRHQARQTPNNLCIRIPKSKADNAWELTYKEVDCWSDALANQLREAGINLGDRVGLCVERSAAAIAAMLAIAKCGAVYVPISPDYPKARTEFMAEDAELKLAFATPIFANKMTRVGVKTLLLEERPCSTGQEAECPIVTVSKDQPAYIIYTSGSTGRPKGVEVPHRGILRLVAPRNTYCNFNNSRRFLQLAPLFFDAATLEVWAPLLNGGCCVVQPGDGIPDPTLLANVLKEEKVTSLWLTSSLFNWLVDNDALAGVPVEELLVGGEALSLAHIKRAQEQLPNTQLINGYGPTETTTFACCYPIPRPIPEQWTAVPIGRPIHETQIFVCDAELREVALGQQGELLITGDGVSLGYLNLPERTLESFQQLRLGGESRRAYRTGDQVRINAEGLVEYIGRIDDQVKISGYRIELGEINNCLTSHPEIRDAAVVVHTNDKGGKRLISYMVARSATAKPPIGDIRCYVHAALPHYMVPNAWIFLDKLPLTDNGKLDRRALPAPVSSRPDIGVELVEAKDDAEAFVVQLWRDHLGLDDVGVNDRYFELGGTSISAVNFVAQLSQDLGQRIPIATFFYAPTIRSFVAALWSDHHETMAKKFPHLVSNYETEEQDLSQYQVNASDDDIAIIGYAGRFAGAEDTDSLWRNLCQNIEALRFASDDELRSAGVSEENIQDPDYIRAYFSLDDLEYFDAGFFGYQPREAELMDPQHRIFLEQAWAALDNAGYSDTERYTNKISVFGGIARDAYSHNYVSKHSTYQEDISEFYVNMGNDKNFPATRVAYQLNLRGPAASIQTACSSGGTALHLAIQSLKSGDCDIAVIGGCRALVPQKSGYRLVEEGALSNDGHLRAFDAQASGMVRGSGAAFVVIKRLKEAVADKDCIRAIIKATAINNDGNAKVGYTAPSVEGQSEVITKALVLSGVAADSIGYVEAHGTGTLLGDPIEVAALTKAYRRFTDAKGYSRIGSIKTNIGHTDAGSAIAGMIKSIMVLEHGKIPASLNYTSPNPNIDFANSPFQVSDTLQDWPIKNGESRYAAVSSFGLGGTNFHAILEQAPKRIQNDRPAQRPFELLTLSAKSTTSLNANIASVRAYLQNHPDLNTADLAYSLNNFRANFNERAIIVVESSNGKPVLIERRSKSDAQKFALNFPSFEVKPGLAHTLYQSEPVFRRYMDLCADIFSSDYSIDVLACLYPEKANKDGSLADLATYFAAKFCLEYAYAKLWIHWTEMPALILTGRSSLAVTACIADMLSVHKAIGVNQALATTILAAGNKQALDDVLGDIIPAVAKVKLLSTVTGNIISIPDLMSAEIWLSHISDKEADNAAEPAQPLLDEKIDTLLAGVRYFYAHVGRLAERSPIPDARLIARQEKISPEDSAYLINAADQEQYQHRTLAQSLGQFWLAGNKVNWPNFYDGQLVRKVPLPTFKFDRKRYLIDLPERDPKVLLFQASSEAELQNSVKLWRDHIEQQATIGESANSLSEMSLPLSKLSGLYRTGIASITPSHLAKTVRDASSLITSSAKAISEKNETIYLLPGGGAHFLNMGKGLYERHNVFRQAVDAGFALFGANTGHDLRALVFPADHNSTYAEAQLKRPSLQLPAIFILQIALAKLWSHWGAKPDALIGHSLGENTAACLAGVLSFEDALGLVSLRGQLFESVTPGGMLSVALAAEQAREYLGEELDLATINSPAQCTISGPTAALTALKKQLDKDAVDAQLIPIDIAAHSRYLDPILEPFRDYLASVSLQPPKVPFISNTTGTWITSEQATSPDYWVNHLRTTVRFSDGVQTLLQKPNRIFLEVGPGKILGSLIKLHDHAVTNQTLSSLRHAKEDMADVVFSLNTAAKLWSLGVNIDWLQIDRDLPNSCLLLPLTPPSAQPTNTGNPLETQTNPTAMPLLANFNLASLPALDHSHGVKAAVNRREFIETTIKGIIFDMSGLAPDSLDTSATFVDLGFDSLFLTQANGRMKKIFKLKLTLKHLMSEAPTIARLSDYIEECLPAGALQEEIAASAPVAPVQAPAIPVGNPTANINHQALNGIDTGSLAYVLATQIQASNALLSILQGSQSNQLMPLANGPAVPASVPTKKLSQSPKPETPASVKTEAEDSPKEVLGHGPFRPIVKSITGELTQQQSEFLQEFIAMYADKTKGSKQLAADIRPYYADPRTVLGFKSIWKEITYSIVAKRSKGARTWDVDGNEYVDCMGGFGAIFFGHAPDFIMDAIKAQADLSVDYGPQSAMAGETARLICEVTGYDRVSFCNTGSEAVLAATRIARTVTGNDLIVTFSGDYHGIFDEMLIRSQVIGGQRRNQPIAPGIPKDSNSNILMLAYDDPESLQIIKDRADEIAAVLIEPIQSRFPEIQPKEFIHQLREITRDAEIPLIFDEVITGFRLHPRGAQAWFDVEADLSCYGKVIGGGMPIGVVAGRARYMDVLDGGPWQYGDDSFPEAGVTYFAGTFVRHPLAIAASNAVIKRIKAEGAQLHQALNYKTAIFAERVNKHYREQDIPVEIIYFGSVFLVRYKGEPDFEFLFFLILRINGGHHIWGPRPGFMTVAHSQEDIETLINAFIIAGNEFRRGGFFHAKEDRPEERYPWTAAQSELWLACKLGDAASAAYNEQVCFAIDKDIDTLSMEFATDRTINRHPSLRCVVAPDEQGMLVKPYMRPEFRHVDLSDLDREAAEAEYQRLAAENIDKPFNFFTGPLLRTLVVKIAANDSRLCVASSHLVSDGWSLEKVMEDIAGYYTAIYQGRHYRGKAVPHLSEFFAAKAIQAGSDEYVEAKEFWCSQYRNNIPAALELPLDHLRPNIRNFNGERHEYRFNNSIMKPLRAYAKEQGCTSFVLLLTAFKLLLSRLSGQQDIVVGVPSAGQPNIGLPTLIAHDVSYLPLRSHIDPNQTFQQLLLKVRDNFLDAKDNQDFSFGELLQSINIPRQAGRLPLVSANFNLDFPFNPLNFDDAKATFLTTPRNHVKYDLSFNLTDEGDFLRVEVDHCSDLFDSVTVERWVNNFLELLKHIGTDPNSPISKLRMDSIDEQERMLNQWNDTKKDYPLENATLQNLIEAQANRTPADIAVIYEGDSLSYQELNQKANQLAHYLRSIGVSRNEPVALLQDRSLTLPIHLLAILKAGGAYLPLDPSYPPERINYLLLEAGVKIVLCDDSYKTLIPEGVTGLQVRDLAGLTQNQPVHELASTNTPDDLAYIIYTSGSTGQPKGVMVEHKSICNRLFWMQEDFALNSTDRVLQKTPYTFDVSVWEFFLPLISGAAVVMAKPDGHKDSNYLAATIAQQNISLIHFVPSMLALFLSDYHATTGKLNRVVCSGEALSLELQARFFSLYKHTELHNYYGPTEAAVDVTKWQCSPTSPYSSVPIGRAVANTQIYILNEFMQPVAEGVIGEIYIGGVQVARGYINKPELTQERFVDNPFQQSNQNASPKLYKTGDLGRFLENGAIEYLGRNDFQVKVRGLRIELGEIENGINQHPAVNTSAVIAKEIGENDTRLIAYIVPNSNYTLDLGDLKAHLAKKLPDYMLPQHLVNLTSMPLTSSGKVDRKALPELERDVKKPGPEAPLDDTERKLADIWCSTLSINRVDPNDDFFLIGGHSLLGVKLLAAINSAFSTHFNLRELFLAPSIKLQASLISDSKATSTQSNIAPYEGKEVPPATSQQQRLWYLEQIDPDANNFTMEASFFVRGKLNLVELERAVNLVISRHQVLRTNFEFKENQLLQKVSASRSINLIVRPLEKQIADSETSISDFINSRISKKQDIEKDNLFEVEVFKIADDNHLLILFAHHIIFDGWSFDLLMQEISTVYGSSSASLPPLPIQYADYAFWQKNYLQSEAMQRQLKFWLETLSGDLPILALPEDYNRPARQASKSKSVPIAISESKLNEIEHFCKASGCTLFMFFIAAYTLTLHRHSRQSDIIIGAPVSGRSASNVGDLLGFFVNTIALRMTINPKLSFNDWLTHIKAICIDSYANQDLPFEELVKHINPERDLSRSPIFQAFFLFEDIRDRKTDLHDLSLEPLEVKRSAVQTDIDLWLKRRSSDVIGGLDYPIELFSENTATSLAQSFSFIIDAVTNEPTITLAKLFAANDDELAALNNWNNTSENFGDELFLERFKSSVKRNPEKRAVSSHNQALDYQTLDQRSNQLAHFLIQEGVARGSLVAICLDRSVDLLVGTLAIWKAGATYVPLDPEYPHARLQYMLEAANIHVILTQQSLTDVASAYSCRRICIDQERTEVEKQLTTNPQIDISAHDLAYIIFTSGSTGKPKGVKVPHGAVNNFLMSMAAKPGMNSTDRLLAVTSLSFDIAVLELYLPLLVGGELIIASAEDVIDGLKLKNIFEQESISFMQATPSTWRMLLADGWLGASNIKILCGGEAFPIDLARKLLLISENVWNMYGPTETTVWSSCEQLTLPLDNISIGKPIANTQCYILNENLEVLPIGVPGELYIGGQGVTQGYLGQEGLTKERFLQIPGLQSNAPLYRTGDLAYWQSTGKLKYLRRVDNQVKLRGYRLELGEVEAVLNENPTIQECAAVVHEFSLTDSRLVAYVRLAQGEHLTSSEMRQFLRTKLPDYMVPQLFIEVDKMPLTPNGKVDRNNLPKPIQGESTQTTFLEPSTDIEISVTTLCSELLNKSPISVDSLFFDIGGHSLLALEFIHKIQAQHNVRITPLEVLTNSLGQLSATIERMSSLNDAPVPEAGTEMQDIPVKKKGFIGRILESLG
ncbi:amino acid adenylation domain-containing protein [Simiduia curdlanivorans]|uniref:Non-ribosomal peptide synthetase/type I polyketide synthase n=1 Tax=Simiduia curdlanivorans TaxID=1492769 RepID=A0ABV8V936_9GAMM|nr:non-ribosomal peptide synthetase/type I polyketide synthase [Simiduia curdlanivorans]MDN3638483.1 amino acid adenylation domain-containing protein [Simiduia curdlanivorans]